MKRLLWGFASLAASVAVADLNTALDNASLTFETGEDAPWVEQTNTVHTGATALRSGSLSDGDGESWLETTVEGYGALSFWWRKTGNSGYSFRADDESGAERTCQSEDWQEEIVDIYGDGEHSVSWSAYEGCSEASESDVAFLDAVKWTPAPETITVTFETSGGSAVASRTYAPGDGYEDEEELPVPTRAGYVFAGWFRDEALTRPVTYNGGCTEPNEEDRLVALRNHALYARWIRPVSVMNGGGLAFTGGDEDFPAWQAVEGKGATGGEAATQVDVGDECSSDYPLTLTMTGAGTLTFRYRCATALKYFESELEVDADDDYSYTTKSLGDGWQEATVLVFGNGEHKIYLNGRGTEYYATACETFAIARPLLLSDFAWTPAPAKMTITFVTNGGDALKAEEYVPGDTYGDLPQPEKEGAEFVGWYLDAELTQWVGTGSIAFRDQTLYARWRVPLSAMATDDIAFDDDGDDYYEGWTVVRGAGATGGDAIVFTPTGKEEEGVGIDTSFYAYVSGYGTFSFKWRKEGEFYLYDVSVNGEWLDVSSGDADADGWRTVEFPVYDGDEIQFTCSCYRPTATGVFSDFTWTPAPDEITVTFDANGGTTAKAASYEPGDWYADLPVPTQVGKTFLGWFEESVFGRKAVEDRVRVPLRDTKLVAKWADASITSLPGGLTLADGSGWRQITTADGAVLEAELSELPHEKEITKGDVSWTEFVYGSSTLEVTATRAGFLSFNASSLRSQKFDDAGTYWSSGGWAEFMLNLDDKEVAYAYGADGKTIYVFVPAGTHTLEFVANGGPLYESWWDDDEAEYVYEAVGGSAYVWLKDFSFEVAGPQENLPEWGGKLYNYRSWIEGDLARFAANYKARIEANANDYEARIGHAVTILAALAESDEAKAYTKQLGFTLDYTRLLFTGEPDFQQDSDAANKLADDALALVGPVVEEALADLEGIPADWSGSVKVSADEWPVNEDVYLDAADVLFARASLEAGLAVLNYLAACDLTVDWTAAKTARDETDWTDPANREALIKRIADEQTAFLAAVRNADCLSASRTWLETALNRALAADAKAVARGEDGVMHFFEYDPLLKEELAFAREKTRLVLDTLTDAVEIDFDALAREIEALHGLRTTGEGRTDWQTLLPAMGVQRVYLGALFEGNVTRSLLPRTRLNEAGEIVPNLRSLRDPTLGGLLPDMTIEAALELAQEAFPNREFDDEAYDVSVTFDANGGEGSTNLTLTVGAPLTAPVVTRDGYEFVCWEPDVTGTVPVEDTIYTAKWAKVMTVTVNGVETEAAFVVGEPYGDALDAITPTKIRHGQVFAGFMNGGTLVTRDTLVGADDVLTAVFTSVNAFYPEDDGEVAANAASVYNGYVFDADFNNVGTVQVKVGKANARTRLSSVSAVVQLTGQKKVTLKATNKGKAEIATNGVTRVTFGADGRAMTLDIAEDRLTGVYGEYTVQGARNLFNAKDAESKAQAAAILANWRRPVNVVWGEGSVSVTVAAKGKAKVTGTVGGKKVSANAQMIAGTEWCCVPVAYAKGGVAFEFMLWLSSDGTTAEVEGDGFEDARVGKPGTLAADAAFRFAEGAKEAFVAALGDTTFADYLPDGNVSVALANGKFVVANGAKAGKVVYDRSGQVDEAKAGANPSALKLTYVAKTGSFKGTFKAYTLVRGKPKAVSVTVAGVMVDGVGYGTATAKGHSPVAITLQ